MARVSTAAILKGIGNPFLKLYKNAKEGYFYFVFDDQARNAYYDESVYVMRLTDMPLDHWVETGKAFAAKVEGDLADRGDPAPPTGGIRLKLRRPE